MLSEFKDIEGRVSEYARERGQVIGPRLGAGKDGMVVSAFGSALGPSALKGLVRRDLYERELSCYRRLAVHGVQRLGGHNVPQLLGYDDRLWVVEMTIVSRPYVLDFASAYLDEPPDFPEEVLDERRAYWAEVFGSNWPAAEAIIGRFRKLGVHLLDPSPSNIAFVDEANGIRNPSDE